MGKKTLNRDYYTEDAKRRRKSSADEQIIKVYNVKKGNIKKPVSGKKDVDIEKI